MTDAPTPKTFFLKPEQIDRLIEHEGACLATDRIVVDGAPVGYMYREESSADEDSGWRFMAGDESTAYMADSNNIGVYALNSIANYDREIIPLLDSPVGAYFGRSDANSPFARLLDDDDPASTNPELNPDEPIVDGSYQITKTWELTLPKPCNRFLEDGTMVLARPGLMVQIVAWDNTPGDSIADRVNQLLASVPPDATDLTQADEDDLTRISYRLIDDGLDTIATVVVNDDSQLLAQIYYEDDDSERQAEAIAASIGIHQAGTE